MTGKMPEEGVNPVEFPETMASLWGAFLLLHRTRPVGMPPMPIPESEIGWFQRNHGIRLGTSDMEVLRRLDDIALEAANGS